MTSAPSKTMKITGEQGVTTLWVFAIGWNLIAWPLLIGFYFASGRLSPWMLLIGIFPLAGIWLGAKAWKGWRAQQRIGKPVLTILQPGVLGHTALHGQIRFEPPLGTRMAAQSGSIEVSIDLQYQLDASMGEDTHTTTLWETKAFHTSLARGTQVAEFCTELPGQLPPATEGEFNIIYWQVLLKTLDGEVRFRLPDAAVSSSPGAVHLA